MEFGVRLLQYHRPDLAALHHAHVQDALVEAGLARSRHVVVHSDDLPLAVFEELMICEDEQRN